MVGHAETDFCCQHDNQHCQDRRGSSRGCRRLADAIATTIATAAATAISRTRLTIPRHRPPSALPLYVAYADYFLYCDWDRGSRQVTELKYENRAWCRIEVVVGWRALQPPLVSEARPFERYRLELFKKGGQPILLESTGATRDGSTSARIVRTLSRQASRITGIKAEDEARALKETLVDDLDGVRIVREVTPVDGSCPSEGPEKGVLSVESDRPPLVLIEHMLGFKSGSAEGERRPSVLLRSVPTDILQSIAGDLVVNGDRSSSSDGKIGSDSC